MALEVNVSLTLPRDELTVPVARHLCDLALGELGVTARCRADVALALTEACTNVVEHSADDHPYAVNITLDERQCSIRVKGGDGDVDLARLERRASDTDHDTGHGGGHGAGSDRDGSGAAGSGGRLDAERGRGIDIMRRLVDRVAFTAEPEDGVIVHLHKQLEFDEGHPVARQLLG